MLSVRQQSDLKRRQKRVGYSTLLLMKPTPLAWLATGLFLAVLIAVVILGYSPTPRYFLLAGKFFAALIALIALYLHTDQARK